MRQLTNGSHLLMFNESLLCTPHLGCPFLHNLLQTDLIPLQVTHSQTEHEIDQRAHQQNIQQVHIPAHIEGIFDIEINGYDLRLTSKGITGLHLEGITAV